MKASEILGKLKGYRTYISLAAAAVVAINSALQAVDLDSGTNAAILSALLALAAYFRSKA